MAERPINELTNLIADLPGLGPRQARRVVQFLLTKSQKYRDELAEQIQGIGSKVKRCSECFRFNGGDKTLCSICADENRDRSVLMVVERDVDVEAVEASSAFKGTYFVLGGLMPMAKQRRSDMVRSKELMVRLSKNDVGEVIFALSTTPEGDYTARELIEQISKLMPTLKLTLLGRGLSVGAEIEYADSETLRNALKNRA